MKNNESIGELLRKTRLEKNLSLKEIEEETKIRETYLQALEEENYSIIPGEIYAKGFLNNYANFLGLDGKMVVQMYKEKQAELNEALKEPEPEVKEKEPPVKNKQKRMTFNARRFVINILILIILVAASIFIYRQFIESKHQTEPATQQQAAEQQTKPSQPNNPTKPASEEQKQTGVHLVITATEKCWINVWQGDAVIFSGTLQAGDEKKFDTENTLKIKFGNPTGIKANLNGKDLGMLTDDPRPATFSFDKSGEPTLVK